MSRSLTASDRKALIRLAYANPDLREGLLPLLKQAAPSKGSLDAGLRQAVKEWELLVTDELLIFLNNHKGSNGRIRWKNHKGSNEIMIEIPDGEGNWAKDEIYVEGPYMVPGSGYLTLQLESGPRGKITGIGKADPKHVAQEAMKWLVETLGIR